MKDYNISANNLWRRKKKNVFLVLVIIIGIAAIVTLLTNTESLSYGTVMRVDKFGENIVMNPKIDNLSLSYGSCGVATDP